MLQYKWRGLPGAYASHEALLSRMPAVTQKKGKRKKK